MNRLRDLAKFSTQIESMKPAVKGAYRMTQGLPQNQPVAILGRYRELEQMRARNLRHSTYLVAFGLLLVIAVAVWITVR